MTRTLNLLIRSQMLYPLSYERLCREMSVVAGPEMPRSEISLWLAGRNATGST